METLHKTSFKTKVELLGLEADASISLNPSHRYIKFILTDDQPNLNGDVIDQSEFPNLIRTGLNSPVKMALNTISPGHKGSVPLGTITQLQQEDNKVVALAALWEAEREEDVDMLKEMFSNKEDLNFSWEIFYTAEEIISEGVRSLKGVILRAATLVGIPAYNGRTKVLAFASQNSSEEGTMNLEEALAKIAELEQALTSKDQEIVTLQEKASKIAELTETITTLETEKQELASYKQAIEAEATKTAKISAIKAKFTEAGIERDEDYFNTNIEKLLSLSDDQLDFMVSELVHFPVSQASTRSASVIVPNVQSENETLSPKEIGKQLRLASNK